MSTPVADTGLDLLGEHVEHADGGALGARPGGGGHGHQRVERLGGRFAPADGLVDVVHQLAGVGGEQVDRLGGVDAGAAAHGHIGVPGPVGLGVVDRLLEAGVGRFDVDAVVDVGLDVEPLHL